MATTNVLQSIQSVVADGKTSGADASTLSTIAADVFLTSLAAGVSIVFHLERQGNDASWFLVDSRMVSAAPAQVSMSFGSGAAGATVPGSVRVRWAFVVPNIVSPPSPSAAFSISVLGH